MTVSTAFSLIILLFFTILWPHSFFTNNIEGLYLTVYHAVTVKKLPPISEMNTRPHRTLTRKAMELYQAEDQTRYNNYIKSQKDIGQYIDSADISINSTLSSLNQHLQRGKELYNVLQTNFAIYSKFLNNTKTEESQTQLNWLENDFMLIETKVENHFKVVQAVKSEKIETMSRSSCHTSTSSSIRAKAKAAEVRALFAVQEAEIKKKQAVLDADLEVLKMRKEAEALKAEAEELGGSGSSNRSEIVGQLPHQSPHEKVQQFIDNCKTPNSKEPQITESDPSAGVTQYLLRKDLLLSRLTFFSDTSANYQVWKASFVSISTEIGLSSNEEIDLLIKYLGPNSKKHALSLRSAYLHDSEQALSQIWQRLDERFGSPEGVFTSVFQRLQNFPVITNKDFSKLYDLADLLQEIEGLKSNPAYEKTLAYFDSSVGINPVIKKLPYSLQSKWITNASSYKESHSVSFPPFKFFVSFMKKYSSVYNDPSFTFSYDTPAKRENRQTTVKAVKTEVPKEKVSSNTDNSVISVSNMQKCESSEKCIIHNGAPHRLADCTRFQEKSEEQKKQFLYENKLCFRCYSPDHVARHCNQAANQHVGEKETEKQPQNRLSNKCTEICENVNAEGKSCAKIMLVNVFVKSAPANRITCYVTVDDQSNRTLAKPELFAQLNVSGTPIEYSMSSCSGISYHQGRKLNDLVVECIDNSDHFDLPSVLECSSLPSDRNEIPTPGVAANHLHLADIAPFIPEIDDKAQMLLLIGRDVPDVHHVLEQRFGPKGAPFAQRLPLGWSIVGEVCLGNAHIVPNVSVKKTYIVGDGRASLLPQCTSKFHVSENDADLNGYNCNSVYILDNGRHTLFEPCKDNQIDRTSTQFMYDFVFTTNVRDNVPSLSVDDQTFLTQMSTQFVQDSENRWSAPLPFKSPRPRLPNNRIQALHRAKSLETSLSKNHEKRQHFVDFMHKLFANGHAEIAPPIQESTEQWYLPIFGVYQPKKPGKIRVVFDSAVKYEGVSLNSVLLQGPDLTNSLLGVLLRFRHEEIAVSSDVEQMFYCFGVHEQDRDYLRFFWHDNNDTSKPLVEYRMCKHVFGNSPSPAIATYGLRKSVEHSDSDVVQFVNRDFYVDDGLTSCPTVSAAVDLVKRTQASMAKSGIRLHKLLSNSREVIDSFPKEDVAICSGSIDFDLDTLPTSRSLGLEWDMNLDCFFFNQVQNHTVTKRGILSTVNSVFDPLGFLSPVVLVGRLILRDVVSSGCDWDEPVQSESEATWNDWLVGLKELSSIRVPRKLFDTSLSKMSKLELHIFSDASEKAISAVVYIVGYLDRKYASFVLGKSKVAPSSGHTIPRLELCAAVLATELYALVEENMCKQFSQVYFYTDSKVVLGYINNYSRRFYTYVTNRVFKIRQLSSPKQWRYVCSDKNPADIGSRGCSPIQLKDSLWLKGPELLTRDLEFTPEYFPLCEPQSDEEVRSYRVVSMATKVMTVPMLGSGRFERYSSWYRLVVAISKLIHIVLSIKKELPCRGWHICSSSQSGSMQSRATSVILRESQFDSFKHEIEALSSNSPLSRGSVLYKLDPFIEESTGLLRVGGRLEQSSLHYSEKHPIILHKTHHIAKLLIRHFHEAVHHQGRVFTEGAVRQGGYWIIGAKHAISSLIFNCVTCRKLRGKFQCQKMSSLPKDRTEMGPAFSNVGLDVFGPWQVVSRKTRSSQASAKRWAVLFTCLNIRAVHIEVVDEMTSSAFINALRRFIAIRGHVRLIRSDRGTNFVGSTDHTGVNVINVEDGQVKGFLDRSGCQWIFNAPHSSHMGGAWERLIGVSRRILESMLLKVHNLTHDVLVTLMAEVSAIINARPIIPVSMDPECAEVLSPSAILNIKLVTDCQPIDDQSVKNLYKDQWRRVQYLADQFWLRWRKEFLQSLQCRAKWEKSSPSLKVNDVVLLKDNNLVRNNWPLGRVSRLFPSSDGNIRKVEICVVKNGKRTFFVRPIVNTVLLVRDYWDP